MGPGTLGYCNAGEKSVKNETRWNLFVTVQVILTVPPPDPAIFTVP